MDRWLYQGLAQPPPAAVLAAETITIDKWFRPASEPVRLPAPCPESIAVQPLDPSPWPVPGDGGWLQPVGEPTWFRKAAQPSGTEYVPDPATFTVESITLDKWFRPASEPVRSVLPRLPGYWAGVLEPTLFEIPTMDTWFRPLSEPTRRVSPVPVGGAVYRGEPSDFVAEPVPDTPGLEWTLPENRMHYGLPTNRPHFTLPENRMHWAIPEED